MQVGQLSTELESAQQEVETVKKREEVMREEMAASKESMVRFYDYFIHSL